VFGIHGSGRIALTVLTATAASVALSISAPVATAGPDDPAGGSTTVAIPPPRVATFSGVYDLQPERENRAATCTNSAGGTCVLHFKTPKPAVVCADTGAWATTAWFFPKADTAAPGTGIELYWAGGGAMTGRAPAADAPGVYAMRIQIADVCDGDVMTSAGLPEADAVFGKAGRSTFSGHVNSLAA
jgi:hypothetical protein